LDGQGSMSEFTVAQFRPEFETVTKYSWLVCFCWVLCANLVGVTLCEGFLVMFVHDKIVS